MAAAAALKRPSEVVVAVPQRLRSKQTNETLHPFIPGIVPKNTLAIFVIYW